MPVLAQLLYGCMAAGDQEGKKLNTDNSGSVLYLALGGTE